MHPVLTKNTCKLIRTIGISNFGSGTTHVMSCHVHVHVHVMFMSMSMFMSMFMSMSCHVMSCHVMSCSCHVMSCHVMSCHVMSCSCSWFMAFESIANGSSL